MKRSIITLCALLFATTTGSVSAAPKPASVASATPKIKVSAKKANAVCSKVRARAPYKRAERKATGKSKLTAKRASAISTEVCRFYAASRDEQTRVWRGVLRRAVKRGLLTRADEKLLRKVLVDPSVLADWKPTTAFGQAVQQQSPGDAPTAMGDTSGAGYLVGGTIGGLIGLLFGPEGFPPGVAVGGAAGDLLESVMTDESATGGAPVPGDGGGDDGGDDDGGGDDGAGGDGGGGDDGGGDRGGE